MNETINMRFENSVTFEGGDTLTIVYRVEAIPEMACTVLLQGFYTMGNRDSVIIELRDSRISIDYSFKVLPDEEGRVQLPVPEGSYFVLVSHRNHLPVMTNARYSFAPGVVTIDFTSPGVAYKPEPGSPDPVYTENDGRSSLRGGDANGDGVINILDFALFARANGSTASPPSSNWDRRADFDGNNVINIFDFQIFGLNNGMVTYVPFWSSPCRMDSEYLPDILKTTDIEPVDFSFSSSTNEVSQGDEAVVDVVFTPTEGLTIYGIDAYVQYDPDVFDIPLIEDFLTPAATYGWAFEHIDMKYDTSAVIETLYALQYSKGTTTGPGWPLNTQSVPYRLTLRVKDDAPGGATEISFRSQFANVLDDQLQQVPVNINSFTFTISVTGVTDLSSPVLPSEYSLCQNYPNPFNPETDIRYGLPEAGHVRLDVYNILGQRIVTLVNEKQEAGYKSVTWNGRDERGTHLSSGIYFYALRVGHFSETRKMILTK
jgi:hypothetical protein